MNAEPHFPLIAHKSPEAIVAYREGKPITARRFLSDVNKVSTTLPEGGHVLNTCQDRYRFAVGFAATLVVRSVSLMPSSLAPQTLNSLQSIAADFITLDDEDILKTTSSNSDICDHNSTTFTIPSIKGSQLATWVFTSGSTGTPLPHAKTWGSLAKNVRIEAQRLGLLDGRAHTIIGTVPPQHMYGFESTVLVALQSGAAFDAGRPFYPADIDKAIATAIRPRTLVTTPFHLHSLLSSELNLPTIDLVVSATAPLSKSLGEKSEARLHTHLLEIYGCTETGQIATRRSTQTDEWQLFDGVELTINDGQVSASGGHLEQPVTISDTLEITHDGHFLLHGRASDIINVAGKRSSFGYLNHQLNAIPGVEDGVFFMPNEETGNMITRLTAFVVSPDLSAAEITQALRHSIDPVFLPRPIVFVDKLPRNTTGKLSHTALTDMAKAHAGRS